MTIEKLVEVHRVTKRFATGEIKSTEFVEERWIELGVQPGRDEIYVNLSDERYWQLVEEGQDTIRSTIRRRSESK